MKIDRTTLEKIAHLARLEIEIGLAVGVPDRAALAARDHRPGFEPAHVGRPLGRKHVGLDDLPDPFRVHASPPPAIRLQ